MSQKAQWKNRKKKPTRPARDAAVAKTNFFFLFSVSRHVSSSKECRVFIRFPTHVALVLFKIVNGRSRHEHLNVCLLCLCFNSHIKRIKFWFRFCYSKKKKKTLPTSLSLSIPNGIWTTSGSDYRDLSPIFHIFFYVITYNIGVYQYFYALLAAKMFVQCSIFHEVYGHLTLKHRYS